MQYAVTAEEMKKYDRNTSEHFGVSSIVLMERAALCICARIAEFKSRQKQTRPLRTLVICGHGNNGGDGLAAARILFQHGYKVQVALVGNFDKATDSCRLQLETADKYGIDIEKFDQVAGSDKSFDKYDIIIDAVLGTGAKRELEGEYLRAVNYMNKCKDNLEEYLLLLAVDIPTGIDTDTGAVLGNAVKSDMTVTFNYAKIGHLLYPGAEHTGKLFVEDIGITGESFLGEKPGAFFYDEDVHFLLPERLQKGNKGTFGKVLMIAGSRDVSGAAILSSETCYRSGAGMVKIITDSANEALVRGTLPEALLATYNSENEKSELSLLEKELSKSLKWATTVCIGPGIGLGKTAEFMLRYVLTHFEKSIIIDADALNLIAENDDIKELVQKYSNKDASLESNKYIILTPHIAEFARLFGKNTTAQQCTEHILEYPKMLSDELSCTVLCKDSRSIVCDFNENDFYINVSGNSGMATAGSGDVLSGLLAALCSYNFGAFKTVCIGSYIHGLAGDLAASEFGEYYMIASDIMKQLQKLMQ